jgi:hypothetical protein
MTSPVLALLAALAPAEGMAGAACRGRSPLHDSTVDGETADERHARHELARAVCARCRVLDTCRASVDTLPPHTEGVWAGKLRTRRGKR